MESVPCPFSPPGKQRAVSELGGPTSYCTLARTLRSQVSATVQALAGWRSGFVADRFERTTDCLITRHSARLAGSFTIVPASIYGILLPPRISNLQSVFISLMGGQVEGTSGFDAGKVQEVTERSSAREHISQENRKGNLIFLDRVSRTYSRGNVKALRDLSLCIDKGDHTAITGPSGSGKTTLLCLASGLDRPTFGRVLFEGQEPKIPAEWTRLRARRIGIVFQSFHLIPGLSAADNVELPMLGVVSGEGLRRRRVSALLERVGLDRRAEHRISEMSGGECQRVAIARALANSPSVILADEPTGNLDSRTANEILDLLETLRRREGVALVIVTHDARASERAARVVRLLDGQVISEEHRQADS